MNQSIVFNPDTDERQLDKEVSKIDSKLDEVDETITPEVDSSGLDGVGSGVSGGRDRRRRGGGGGGGGAGVGALASKIPKPIGGVAVGLALPVALGGAVGAGMLSAMHSASARMQTSTKLIGQAWNNVWRPLGDKLDQLFIRDVAKDLLSETESFEESLRKGEWMEGINTLLTGQTPDPLGGENLAEELGSILGGTGGLLGGAKAGAVTGGAAGSIIPGAGTAGGAVVGAIIGGIGGTAIGSRVGGKLGNLIEKNMPDIPSFTWPSLPEFSWPNVKEQWAGWPEVGKPQWPSSSAILDQFPSLSASSIRDAVLGGGGGGQTNQRNDSGNTGSDNDGFLSGPLIPGLASGGRVQDSGVARVHKGEMVGDTDRLVSELAAAIGDSGGQDGGGSTEVDTSSIEQKLDRLHRDLQRLGQAMDGLEFTVDNETLGRAASNGQQNRVSDRNPLV